MTKLEDSGQMWTQVPSKSCHLNSVSTSIHPHALEDKASSQLWGLETQSEQRQINRHTNTYHHPKHTWFKQLLTSHSSKPAISWCSKPAEIARPKDFWPQMAKHSTCDSQCCLPPSFIFIFTIHAYFVFCCTIYLGLMQYNLNSP